MPIDEMSSRVSYIVNYLLLIPSLSTQNAIARTRIRCGLKTSEAALLRDGVDLMPGAVNE